MPTTHTDLPNIGNPARRALATVGCTRLEQVAAMSERELLALHGFGPKALRILREAMAAQGRGFAPAVGVRSVAPRRADWDDLAHQIGGEVIVAGDPGYEAARKPAIPRFHGAQPRAVVQCATPADVVATLGLARRTGVDIAIRGGGHSFAGYSSTDGIVVDVGPMHSVVLSGDGAVATIGAGARLGDVYDALAARDRTIPAGCGPTVGIAGLALGGGLGILGRTHGLTADALLAAEVVLADGRLVRCDENHAADLFWALRGAGGGNFGVVTSLTFRTVPQPAATAFHLTWPDAQAATVVDAWQAWAPEAPDALSASLLASVPADPARSPTINLFGAMLGSEPEAAALLRGLEWRSGSGHHP